MFDFFGHGELIVFCFVVDVLISLTWKPRGPSQLVTQLEANLCPKRGRPRCMWREARQKIGRTKRCRCGLNLSKIFWGDLSQFQIPHWRLLWKTLISSDHEMWNNVKCDITIDTFCCFHCRCDSRKDCLWYSYWKTGLGWRDDRRKLKKVGGKPQRLPESLPSNALGITSINEYSASGRIPTSIIFQELKCGFVQKHPNQESNVFVVSHMFITTIGIMGVYLIPCCWLQNDRYSTRSQWWYNDGVLVVVPVLVLCRWLWHKSALWCRAGSADILWDIQLHPIDSSQYILPKKLGYILLSSVILILHGSYEVYPMVSP